MNANVLRRVQELDDRLVSLRDQQKQDAALLERDPAVERARRGSDEASAAQRDAEARLLEVEQELKTVSERSRALHRRLYGGSVRNPHELLEMQQELETLTARVGELEDRALIAMESAETATAEAHRLAAILADEERARADRVVPLTEHLTMLREAIAGAEREREAAFSALPANERTLYARIAAKHRPAVVSIAGDACGGCHLPLSADERHAVRSGERMVQCSSCDRILVP